MEKPDASQPEDVLQGIMEESQATSTSTIDLLARRDFEELLVMLEHFSGNGSQNEECLILDALKWKMQFGSGIKFQNDLGISFLLLQITTNPSWVPEDPETIRFLDANGAVFMAHRNGAEKLWRYVFSEVSRGQAVMDLYRQTMARRREQGSTELAT